MMNTLGALAEQLATLGTEGRQSIVLDIERQVRELYQIDESEGLLLDHQMRRWRPLAKM